MYCVYFTTYKGDKLPPFYIGSSSVAKVTNGYHGSVASKEYKNIWKEELKLNPTLFETKIVSCHDDRKEATLAERILQKQYDAIKSPLFINLAYAAYDSFTDRDQSGANNPMFGTHRAGEANPFYGMKHSESSLAKMRGRSCTEENKELYRSQKIGKPDSDEVKKKKSIAKLGKPPNSAKILKEVVADKFLCAIATRREYTYANACQRLPDIKHLFWSKKIK